MKRFSVHFHVDIPLQIVILNNFKNCRSPSKIKPCAMIGSEISKKYQKAVMYKMLTIK
jgi:hypothetical protein